MIKNKIDKPSKFSIHSFGALLGVQSVNNKNDIQVVQVIYMLKHREARSVNDKIQAT